MREYVTIDTETMKGWTLLHGLVVVLLLIPKPAAAHPVPFSYLDVHLGRDAWEIAVVAHIFDLAHDLHVDPPARLLDANFLATEQQALVELLAPRFQFTADGAVLKPSSWSPAEALPDRQSVRILVRYDAPASAGTVALDAHMFPYDPAHQTFVNVYEGDSLTLQSILDLTKTRLDYYPGSRQGALAVFRRFLPAGLHHVLLGPDHLVFLIGLLLLGGTTRQLALIAVAFISGNALALALTVLNILHPPARIIEPAVALSIVYVGADNLMVRGGRDTRVWIALAFGVIHGFWFANGLREIDLPSRALGLSLFSFDVGVELCQASVIFAVGSAIAWLHSTRPAMSRRLLSAGSVAVILFGVYWFVRRVYFPGGFA